MMLLSALSAVLLSTLTLAAPVRFDSSQLTFKNSSITGHSASQYQQYTGDGSVAAGWPAKSQWISFEDMFDNNSLNMKRSCSRNGWAQDVTELELGMIKSGIQAATNQTAVDQRFILAVVMQESGGCVRVPATNNGVRNPGLMQDHNGAHTCNDAGNIVYTCPQEQINGMIMDGTAGTGDGDGLVALISQAVAYNQGTGAPGINKDFSQVYYQAARLYNSGSTSPIWSDLNDPNGATASYVNDIANRLTGWLDPS